MRNLTAQVVEGRGMQRFIPQRDGAPIPYREVLRCWQRDETFRSFFVSLLAKAKFAAYRWETPPVTTASADRDFEFVLLDAPALNRTPDVRAFAEQFSSVCPEQHVVAFPNLGNDAVLVVPCPSAATACYGHLGAFVRSAPAAQIHELWRVVGTEMDVRVSSKPIWLSTAGMGISWLHVRLDERPKYYGFAEYMDVP